MVKWPLIFWGTQPRWSQLRFLYPPKLNRLDWTGWSRCDWVTMWLKPTKAVTWPCLKWQLRLSKRIKREVRLQQGSGSFGFQFAQPRSDFHEVFFQPSQRSVFWGFEWKNDTRCNRPRQIDFQHIPIRNLCLNVNPILWGSRVHLPHVFLIDVRPAVRNGPLRTWTAIYSRRMLTRRRLTYHPSHTDTRHVDGVLLQVREGRRYAMIFPWILRNYSLISHPFP